MAYLDDYHRARLRTLAAIDELVDAVMTRLEESGELDNTYVFYSADNGYAIGTHRRQPGKSLSFEEDIHVPFVVRGPGVPSGVTDSVSTYGMVDLSRTIMELAGAKPDYEDDGVFIDIFQKGNNGKGKGGTKGEEKRGNNGKGNGNGNGNGNANGNGQANGHGKGDNPADARHGLVEYWVYGVEEGIYGADVRPNTSESGATPTWSWWKEGQLGAPSGVLSAMAGALVR